MFTCFCRSIYWVVIKTHKPLNCLLYLGTPILLRCDCNRTSVRRRPRLPHNPYFPTSSFWGLKDVDHLFFYVLTQTSLKSYRRYKDELDLLGQKENVRSPTVTSLRRVVGFLPQFNFQRLLSRYGTNCSFWPVVVRRDNLCILPFYTYGFVLKLVHVFFFRYQKQQQQKMYIIIRRLLSFTVRLYLVTPHLWTL